MLLWPRRQLEGVWSNWLRIAAMTKTFAMIFSPFFILVSIRPFIHSFKHTHSFLLFVCLFVLSFRQSFAIWNLILIAAHFSLFSRYVLADCADYWARWGFITILPAMFLLQTNPWGLQPPSHSASYSKDFGTFYSRGLTFWKTADVSIQVFCSWISVKRGNYQWSHLKLKDFDVNIVGIFISWIFVAMKDEKIL